MTTALSLADRATLSELEDVIERGLETFVDVGLALARIKDGSLYPDATFEIYLDRRWDMSLPRGYALMQGARVVSCMQETPELAPTNERQAAALAPFKDDPEALAEIMVEVAADGPVTAKTIAAVVKRKLGIGGGKKAKRQTKSRVALTIPRSRDATLRVGDYTSAVAQLAQAMLAWNVAGADDESLSYLLACIGSLKQQITTIETATRSELEVIESAD